MKIEATHHVDASKPDVGGMYEYYYEYYLYRFSENEVAIVARSYTSEPQEAHFLRIEIAGVSRLMKDADFQEPLVKDAIRHLQEIGMRQLNWLSGRGDGYEPVQ